MAKKKTGAKKKAVAKAAKKGAAKKVAAKKKVSAVPAGYHTVTPHLVCRNASGAIDFYKKAFGAKERYRMLGPDGKIAHAEITIGNSIVMLGDEIAPDGGDRSGNPRRQPGQCFPLCAERRQDCTRRQSAPAPSPTCRRWTCSGATATASCRIPSATSGRWRRTSRTCRRRKWRAAARRRWRSSRRGLKRSRRFRGSRVQGFRGFGFSRFRGSGS